MTQIAELHTALRREVGKVVTGVSAHLELIERAIAAYRAASETTTSLPTP